MFLYDYINGKNWLKYRMISLNNAVILDTFNKKLFSTIKENLDFRKAFVDTNSTDEWGPRKFKAPELEQEFFDYIDQEIEFTDIVDLQDWDNFCWYDVEVLSLLDGKTV
jgi:hypothetical protein